MRKISRPAFSLFFAIYFPVIVLSFFTSGWILDAAPLGDFRAIMVSILAIILFFVYLTLAYRIFLSFMPLTAGEIAPGSKDEFIYFVYVLFFLLGFYSLTRSGVLPVPLMRLVYIGLGAKLGNNTYPSGFLDDPIFIKIGKNGVIGQNSLVIPHVMENDRLAFYPIEIGDNVTVGALTMIMAGVKIGNNSIVAAGSVVSKGTVIGNNELWAGTPAKLIKKI